MKALFKHLSAKNEGECGSVVNNNSSQNKTFSSPFVSTTFLAVLLGIPQVPIIGNGKAIAQTSCPAGTVLETVQLTPRDSLPSFTLDGNTARVRTTFTLSEEFPSQVIDTNESFIDPGIYGGLQGPNLRLNIGPGKPPETGNLSTGSATLTITFDQPVTLASPLTLLDVDRNGARDNNRIFQDVVTVTASNNGSNVPVTLQALGQNTRISGNTASGINENSLSSEPQGNVSVNTGGAVSQISFLYTPGTEFGSPGQDQTVGLAPFTICSPVTGTGSIGDTVYRDNNNNNIQDAGDVGIPGVPVTLTFPNGATENATTDANGIYTFSNLPAGNYTVSAATPDGLTPTQTQTNPVNLQAGQNIDTVDFGFGTGQVGTIGDTVYRDNNNNNVQDAGDVGIPGVTVTLTLPNGTTQTATTDANGIYTFPNLPAGSYTVSAATPDGLIPTQTQANPVNLQAGQNIDTVDFGFAPTGTIGDTVYQDDNGDGTQQPGEPGIPNVEVTLVNPGPDGQLGTDDDTTQATTTTNDSGNYSFPNVPPGNYRVVVNNPPNGFTPTQIPPETVSLQPGQTFNDADFGFRPQQLGTIGDTVYNDTNGNSQQDAGENGISGATVILTLPGADGQLGTDDDTTQNTTTDQNGIYTFSNLPAGSYRVAATNPGDFTPTQTQPDAINLGAGQNIDTVDFGFAPGRVGSGQSGIGDTVYNDTNRNNQQDNGETGIPGATVTLIDLGDDGEPGTPDDGATQTTTTNDNGIYSFTGLPAGNYRVIATTPDGLTPTQAQPNTVTLTENQVNNDVDFGFAPQQDGTGSIGDTVYNDTNRNNQQDNGETGIPGVTVTLTLPGPDGQLGTGDDTTQTATTDNNGIYGFTNLPAANYRVSSDTPNGFTPTQTQPDIINLQAGQDIETIDFGFAPEGTGSIGDTVYNDTNGNSQQDNGETGVPGVTVTLIQPGTDGQLGTDDDTTQTTTTNENGNYSFPNLPAGNYRVTIDNPDGFTPTQTPPDTITLTEENPTNNDVDFGLTQQGGIGDTVYNDTNRNSQQDDGETGVPNVTVTLTQPGADGQLGTEDDTTQTTTTDDNGNYSFPNLPTGNYRVTIDNPDGFSPTQTPPDTITLTEENPINNDVDFGLIQGGSIGDEVFNDTNGNGVRDEGEPGIEGVTVTLTLPGEDGELGTGDDTTQTETTDENGNYSFTGLPLGNYSVQAERPSNFRPTTETTLSTQLTQDNPNPTNVDFGFQAGVVGASGPGNLRLVKRITNVLRDNQPLSGIAFNQFVDDESDDDDNILQSSPGSSPVGIVRLDTGTPAQSGDIVEYTIYFRSEGGQDLNNVKVCDLIPNGTTFVNGSIVVNGAGTGGDSGTFLSPLSPVPADFQNICSNGTPANGAVLTNLGTLPAGGQFGFVRFRVRVN